MAPSAIVALCLLALASAAPQSLQNLQCATSCDMSKQPTIGETGKTYTYSYNVQSTINVAGVQDAATQGQLAGTVQVSRINPCEMAIKFTSNDETALVNKYPILIALAENDQFGKICAHQDDDAESVNIKKGIASAIQYSLSSMEPTKKIVAEKSVLGTCPTAYSVKNNGQVITINKETIHSECQDHAYSHSDIPSILTKSPMPVHVSKSVCQQVISNAKVPQTITCKDTKVVRPAYGTYKHIEATQDSTLQFVSESADMSSLDSVQGSVLTTKKWTLDHSMPAKNPAIAGKLDSVLKNVCSMIQGQGHQDAASYTNEAIELLKHIPADAFITVLNKIRAGEYCTNFVKLETLFMDAIAFIGEPGAVTVMAQEVASGRVTGGRLALYTAALHLLSKPTVNHVAALAPIAAMANPSSTLTLAAASIVNKHCMLVNGCENTAAVKNILNLLVGKLETQCTPAFSNSKAITVLTTLKALGNIGFMAPEHAEKIVKCAKTEGVDVNVRFAAAMALKGAPCMTPVKNILLASALDASMNTEVRIGFYLAGIKCVEAKDIQEIVAKITTDSNKQVQSFVFAHLTNLKITNWPQKEQLRKWLSNINIPNSYESNIFKYSKNIEVSYNSPVLGLGAAVDSNVVYEQDSYLPRLVNLGLDMNLLGSFINIGEVGARVEGLDPIMNEAFGPESYLYKTPLKSIIQDTTLFVKQNGVNLFNKLDKLIKQQESLDINAIMQSVSKFLMANNIKLPKTDLYAKLMGKEFAFLSVAGPMQQVNINHIIETITSTVVDALVAAKNLDIDIARAGHLHLDYSIPTIQGIPLRIKLLGTTVVGVKTLSKFESKASAHDAMLKIIPSLSIAIDGHIGYGATAKHGLKMKNSIYSTNGFALYATLSNGKDLEMKVELPEKMELINVKSEAYLMTADKMMNEVKVSHDAVNEPRFINQQCITIAEPITGLHICYNINIPNAMSSKSLPLGLPVSFKVYLQKADPNMKGYRVLASIKNKADKKALKMIVGTYGSATSTESSIKFTYTKEATAHIVAANVKSVWFASNVEATFANQADSVSLQITADHKFTAGAPVAAACKFNVKNEAIVNGKQYQISALAGLTKSLTDAHRFLIVEFSHALNGDYSKANLLVNVDTVVLPIVFGVELAVPTKAPWFAVVHKVELKVAVRDAIALEALVLRKGAGQYLTSAKVHYYGSNVITIEATHTVAGKGLTNFNIITDAKAILGTWEIGNTFTLRHENFVFDIIWELKNAGANIFIINLKHSMATKLYTTIAEIKWPTLPKTLKINHVIEVVEFLNYKLITDVQMDNTAILHIEGPVSCQFSNALMKYNIDLKMSGAFEGAIKVIHAALISLEKTQITIDMRHATTPLVFVDIIADRTNAAETTAKAIIHLPIVIKAEYAAIISSGLIHTTMNTFVLPTTSVARRFKGYADWNLTEKKIKADLFWDAEKDANMKLSLTTAYLIDTSMGKILVKGDLALTSLTYGYKLEALLASPFEWFHGTSGVEFAVTAPSKKMFITKALCTVEYAESLVIFKPLLAFNTLYENKYEVSGSIAVKKLAAPLNFGISSELTIIAPGIKKITIANKVLHEDKNGACAFTVKTGITGLNEPIGVEFVLEASANKLATVFKVEKGASIVTGVTSNIALISGLKAFDITVNVNLPITSVKAFGIRATKTVEGTTTLSFTRNQVVLAKLHYIMASLLTHTISLECPSRTIEIFAAIAGNEMTLKVFPQKNLSPKVIQAIVRVAKKTGSAHIECFITAPSLANEMRIAAEFALADPAVDNKISVDIHFPVEEFMALVNAIVKEVQMIVGDLVKDGLLPDLTVLLNKLKLVIQELPKYLVTLKMQLLDMFTKYWPVVKNWVLKMCKELYEADIIAFLKSVPMELLRCWEILKIEVPVIYNNLMATLMKSELWKMLHGMVMEIINHIPVEIFINYWTIVKNWIMNIWVVYEADVIALLNTVQIELLRNWEILKIQVPIIYNNLMTILKKSGLWEILYGTVMKVINHFPVEYNIIVDFFNKVILTTVAEIKGLANKIMTLPIFNIEGVWNILMTDVPAVIAKLTTQLLNTDLVKVIVGKVQELRAFFPTVEKAVVELWAHVIVPSYTDLVAMITKLTKINFTNATEFIEILVQELITYVNSVMTHLVHCETVQMIITKVKLIIKANPIIGTLYDAVAEVVINIVMALKNDLVKLWKRLMAIPMINKLVNYILHIFKSTVMNMEPITWKSFTTGVHVFVTDVLGMTYALAANHLTAVVTLPCSVTTLGNIWTTVTAYLSALVADVVNTLVAVIERIPVVLKTVKKYALVYIAFIAEQIPIIVKAIKTWVPKIINDLIPTINNFIEFLMNTEVFKFLMAKVDEVIKMYPAEFNAVKAFVERVMQLTIKYTVLVYNKMMEIPVIKKIVDYIWQLINRKDLQNSMVSSVSSVSSIVSSYTSSVYNNIPAFIKLHTPSALSSWVAPLVQ